MNVAFAIFAKVMFGYMTLAAFLCLVLAAELYWPRGRLIDRHARFRAISFLLVYIPFAAVTAVVTGRFLGWLSLGPVMPFAIGAITAAIVGDFFYYWYHRAQHSIPLLWRYHSVHHSVEELGAGTGYHHLLEAPMLALCVSIPVALLVSRSASAEVVFVLSIHGYYIHSTTRLNFGPFAWLIADNRTHRIHHSLEVQHFDKNFGAFTLIWDRLFGTAHFPKLEEWPAVGLSGQPEPKNVRDYVFGQPGVVLTELGNR